MAEPHRWTQPAHARPIALLLSVALLGGLLAVAHPVRAFAAGTVLFSNDFVNRTVDGTGTVTTPTSPSGTNTACLSAAGNTATGPLLSCTTSQDLQGAGKLRLTRGAANQIGAVYGATSFPTSSGLDVTFNTYQYGGTGADGMSFVLAAVDPANPVAPATVGPGGGSLGYSPNSGAAGLPNGYLGVGLDVYGNYSSPGFQGSDCSSPTNISAAVAGAVVVRGPGNGTTGYCGLTTSYTGTAASKVTLRSALRATATVPVEVLVNPGTTSFTADSGVSVAAGTYKVVFTPVGGTARTLTGTLPTVPSGLYTSGSYLNGNGYPKQLAFGFIGSTGGSYDVHEASNVKVVTFNAVAQLGVATTSHVATSPAPGDPVSYVVTPSVKSGVDVSRAVTMTQTVPAGVTPVGAYGSGWSCAAPSGQSVTCTTTATSFGNGTTLPVIDVVGIVTGSAVTASSVQNGSTTAVASENANPASVTTTTAGTLPTAPSGVTLSSTSGSTSGGGPVTISGSNLTGATAVEIGTTAEQQGGTPVVLLPCSSQVASPCFTVSGSTLVVASWPSRSSPATVGVRVVTLGVQNSPATYTYANRPATPAAPTATAGVTSATLSWAAPDNGGSTITGYVVTPYLSGTAQTAVTYDASTTTRTLTGLTAGGSYTFTVAAVNGQGTSAASPASAAVVPYTLPGAPTITGAAAGDSAATLTWTAPSSNGFSALTGYVVTPYLNGVAQTATTFSGSGTTQTVTGLTAGSAYTFRVAATNAAGTGPASAASTAVVPNVSPSLTFPAPPGGEVGVAYSQQLTVNDGTGPFTWSVGSGSLPPGLTLGSATGLLSGTPTSAGSSTFTVQVTDASGQSATRSVTLAVAARPSVTFSPPAGEVGVAYGTTPTVSGGTGPFTWAVTAGSVPAGLTLDPGTGRLSGTPTAAGSYSLTLQATDALGQTASRTTTVVVAAPPSLSFSTTTSPQVGVAYSNPAVVSGGTGPFTYAVAAGSLPTGLGLDTGTGVVSGTPTTTGSSTVTLAVTDAFGQSAIRTVTLTVVAGPIVITKTAGASSTVPGGTVSYTITVANTGSSTVSGVSLSDPLAGVLDDATYAGDASATVGTTSYASGTLGWTGTLAAGSTATITYSVRVANPVTGNQVLTNTVTSPTLGTSCASGSADPRCTATVTVSGLSITKTADAATTTPGGTVRFTVVVTNTGRTTYAGATFTDSLADVLDDATYAGNATATSGSLSFVSPSLTWTGNLAVGASATVTYTVTVASPDTGNRSLTGTVVSPTAGSACPSGNPAASCTATVTVLVPALSITDTAAVATTTPGSTVAHTVSIANTGQTPYAGATVTVALAGALDDGTYDGDAVASSGTVTYADGPRTLTWTGDLATGATATVTFSVTVGNPDPGDRSLTTVASSSAAGSTCPTGSTSPACTSTVRVLVPALSITTTTDVSSTTPGSVVRHTVQVANTGQTPYTGATLSDDLAGVLDDATSGGDAAATTGTVALSGSVLRWSGDLAVGASATITFSVSVKNPDTGDRSLRSSVTSTTPFSTCPSGGTDPRCSSSVPVLLPALALRVSTDVGSVIPGGTVRYTFTATNTGQTAYTGATVLLGLGGALDDATSGNDLSVSTGSLAQGSGGTTTWTLDLPVGASATATGSLVVRDPDPGDRDLLTTLASDAAGSTCPTPPTGSACTSSVPVQLPGLTITKTADRASVQPGQRVVYTISVVNDGQSVQDASLTDPLTQVLTDATYDGDAAATAGTVTYAGSTIGWSGTLAVGASATITYSVTVRDPDPGDKLLTSTVVSPTPGSNCTRGSSDGRCTVAVRVLVPRLSVVITADRASAVPGGRVTFTETVTNTGSVVYAAASVTAGIAGVLDDATYAGDAAATSGTVSRTGSTITWTGDLAVGASATITSSFTVAAADVGDDLLVAVVSSSATGSTCTAGSTDPRCTVTVPVARLQLAQSYAETSTTPGSLVHLNATFTNTGQVALSDVTVVSPSDDTTDDAIPNGDQTASSGSLQLTSAGITWTGSIDVGQTITVRGTLTVRDPDPGNRLLTGTLVSDAPGSSCPGGSPQAACTASLPVLVPQLSITKTADTAFVLPGGTARYTLTIANTGQTAYTGASVVDTLTGTLDDATFNGDATASRGALTFASPTLTWTGDLPAGATATVAYSVTATNPGTGDKAMVNTVTSSAAGSTCPTASSSTACRVTVPVRTPALTVVKTADVANATLGSAVRYTITVTNSGQTDYASVSLSDPLTGVLDDATYSTAATATRGTVTYAASTIGWSGALAVGQSATISYGVTIRNPRSGDGTLANTVTSPTAGSNCGSGSTDARCTATVVVTNSTTIVFDQTADVAYATPGQKVTYTILVRNTAVTGLGLAIDLSVPLADVLDDGTYGDDARASTGTVAVSGSTLTWSTGLLAINSTTTITYSVTVNGAVTGNQVLTSTVTSGALLQSSNCLAGSTDPRCTTTVPVARLSLAQSYTETSTTPGSVVHLTATFTNTGRYPYTGVTVTSLSGDTVDDADVNGDQTASSGSLVLTASGITWTGNIGVGQTVTVRGTLTVKDPDPGNRLLTGTLVSGAPGSSCPSGGTDPACTASLPVLVPRLSITKTADATFVVPGGSVRYTVAIANTGETPYVGATVTDNLAGVLDDAALAGTPTASRGTLSYASPTLTWTGDLPVGATATVGYTVTASTVGAGDKTMVNPVWSTDVGSTCSAASSAAGCRVVVPVLTPALTLTVTTDRATAAPGDTVAYTVVATNTGQTTYGAATVDVPLAGLLDDGSVGPATATRGTVTHTGPTLTWTGPLAPGDSATVTFGVTVADPVGGDFRLATTLVSGTQGSSCPAGTTNSRCTSSVGVAGLRIVNAADVTTTQPGGVIRYTGTFTNVGQVPYVGISVTDDFTGALDDAVYGGDATASSGSLVATPGSGRIVWTGDVPVGATVTITGSVTVRDPDPGDQSVVTRISTAAAGSSCTSGSNDPACVVVVPVLIPRLEITSSTDVTTAGPGQPVRYTLTIANTGQTAYRAAVVRQSLTGVLDDATDGGDATASRGAVSVGADGLRWTGDLGVGQTAVVTLTVTVDAPDLGDRVLASTVSSDEVGSTCPTGGPASACSTRVTVLVPRVEASVVASTTTTTPGSTVGYTVTVTNTGETDAPGATLTVDLAGVLDDAAYGGDATSTTGGASFAGSTLTWTGDLPVGASATTTFTVLVRSPATGDRSMVALLDTRAPGGTCDQGAGAAGCRSVVAVLLPGLAVSTSADRSTATPGDRVRFTVTVANTGETDQPAASVSASLADVLDDATLDGSLTASAGGVSVDGTEVTWTGRLARGESATLTFGAVVRAAGDLGDRRLVVTAVSSDPGSTCPAGADDPTCTASVTVLVPHLAVRTSASSPTATPGGVVAYTTTITNDGQTPQTDVRVATDLSGLLNEATYAGDARVTVGGGTLGYTAPTLVWTGTLPVGATATVLFSVLVNNPATGDRELTTTVSSAAPGSSCPADGSGSGCTTQVQVLVPALSLTKTASTTTVVAGSAVKYTITVANTGQTAYAPATFRDDLAAVLDDATYRGDATATSGTVTFADGVLAWSGPLAVGASATVTYTVDATFPAAGDRVLRNTVVSDSPGSTCPTGTTRARCRTAVGVLVPALNVTKAAGATSVVAGGTVAYTLTATNTGEADYASAALTDALGGVLDDGTYAGDATATSGTVSVVDRTLTWTGALARGATVVIGYSVVVDPRDLGDGRLVNSVTSGTVGSTCPTDGAPAACTVETAVEASTLTLSDLTPSFRLVGPPGSTVEQDGAVNLTVTTNSPGGYSVAVRATEDRLHAPGTGDTIPVDRLEVRPGDGTTFTPLSTGSSVPLHSQDRPSAAGGDAVSSDYRVQIPFVDSADYSTEIEYIVTAQ